MHVADMDFAVAPAITRAIARRAQHPVYGYTQIMPEYYDSVCGWQKRRHGWTVERDWVIPVIGVLPIVAAALRALCGEDRTVMVQPPVYDCFYHCIERNHCRFVCNDLVLDRRAHTWSVDLDDFERTMVREHVSVFVLCHPHNPVGRVWTRAELEGMAEMCIRHDVVVISDEIHSDILMPGHRHIPFASLDPEVAARTITCTSPSKPFNMAGLQIANACISNPALRARVMEEIFASNAWIVNPFGVVALMAAYDESEAWLDACNAYIYENYRYFDTFVREQMPGYALSPLEGTYLAWLDIAQSGMSSEELYDILSRETGLKPCVGANYGAPGRDFLRFNLALPKSRLVDGCRRLCSVVRRIGGHDA